MKVIREQMGHDPGANTAAVTWPGAAEQIWAQGEARDLHKSSGKSPPLVFQCWPLSAIYLQVYV